MTSRSTDRVANLSIAGLLGINLVGFDPIAQLDFGSGSIATLLLVNISCAALGVFVGRPYFDILFANSERQNKRDTLPYFPTFMSLLSILNLVVIAAVLSNFKNLSPLVLALSCSVFFLFGFFLHGEIELESSGTRSSAQRTLWGLYDNSLPTFLPAVCAIYLVLVPGDFFLVHQLPVEGSKSAYQTVVLLALVAGTIGAYILLSKFYPAALEISQQHPVSVSLGKTSRWVLFSLGFVVFDRLLTLAISKFEIEGISEFFFLSAVGVVPYRLFGIVYMPSSGFSKVVGIAFALAYFVVKCWKINILTFSST